LAPPVFGKILSKSIVDVGGIILDSPLAIDETPTVGVGNGFAFFTLENPLLTFLLRFVNCFLILSKLDDVIPELVLSELLSYLEKESKILENKLSQASNILNTDIKIRVERLVSTTAKTGIDTVLE
jgi:hypothetical protein